MGVPEQEGSPAPRVTAPGGPSRPRLPSPEPLCLVAGRVGAVLLLGVVATLWGRFGLPPGLRTWDAEVVQRAVGGVGSQHTWLTPLRLIESGTYPWVLHAGLAAAAVAAVWWGARTWWQGCLTWALAVFVWWECGLIKTLVARARPDPAHPVWQAHGFGFPSTHAASAAAFVVCIGWLWWPWLRTWQRAAMVAFGLVLVVVVGADRVLLGVHYPTDVLAGWLLGSLSATAALVAGAPTVWRSRQPGS